MHALPASTGSNRFGQAPAGHVVSPSDDLELPRQERAGAHRLDVGTECGIGIGHGEELPRLGVCHAGIFEEGAHRCVALSPKAQSV